MCVPSVWDSLKPDLHAIDYTDSFKCHLKSTLFFEAYGSTQHGPELCSTLKCIVLGNRHMHAEQGTSVMLCNRVKLTCRKSTKSFPASLRHNANLRKYHSLPLLTCEGRGSTPTPVPILSTAVV